MEIHLRCSNVIPCSLNSVPPQKHPGTTLWNSKSKPSKKCWGSTCWFLIFDVRDADVSNLKQVGDNCKMVTVSSSYDLHQSFRSFEVLRPVLTLRCMIKKCREAFSRQDLAVFCNDVAAAAMEDLALRAWSDDTKVRVEHLSLEFWAFFFPLLVKTG